MKLLFTLLSCFLLSISGFSQNGIYLYGFLENAPQESVEIETIIYSNPPVTVFLETESTGEIPTTWVELPDENGLGLQTSFEDCDSSMTTNYFTDSLNTGDFPIFLTYCEDSIANVYGCTDPLAINYNPQANVDDGSCEYDTTPAENDLCADAAPIEPGTIPINNSNATQNEGIWGECWGFGSGEGEQSSVWYSFTTPDVPASIHLEAVYDGSNTLTDTQFGIFEECGGEMIYCDGNEGEGLMSAFDFDCGELEQNTTYLLMIDGYFGDAGTANLVYSVDTACTVYGCTDPEAINYNPEATIDDGSCEYDIPCESNAVSLTINSGSWGYEMSWNLVYDGVEIEGDGDYADNSEYDYNWCLEDGCYTFELFDSYGDGWNGGTYQIVYGDSVLASGTLANGLEYGSINFGINQDGCNPDPVYGCTDPEAINYNPEATVDDGSCEYESDCTPVFVQLDGSSLSAGEWFFSNEDSLLLDGYYQGSDLAIETCLQDGCYSFTYIPLDSNTTSSAEVVCTIFIDNQMSAGTSFINGGSLDFQVGAGCDTTNVIYGCTDPEAINYNPEATVDDGSCIYGIDCSVSFQVIPDSLENVIWIVPTENILESAEILWDFGDGTTSTELYPQHTYEDEGPYELCVTVSFGNADSSTCSVTYCAEVTGTLINGSGFGPTGFAINIVNNADATGIVENQHEENAIHLFPNPVSDQLNIEFDGSGNEETIIHIYAITGKLMVQRKVASSGEKSRHSLDVGNLPAGVYIIELKNDKSAHISRFVKTK